MTKKNQSVSTEENKTTASQEPPKLNLKNSVKNDGGVEKIHAKQSYEEKFDLAVRHGQMTEERKGQLLEKISKIASNDVTVFAGTESDIKVSKSDKSGEIIIDMVVHFMKSDEEKAD